jgi:hypothetical protein
MSGIFARLNFPSSLSGDTIAYSDKTINTMNSMPKLLNEWQTEDVAGSNTGGYFKNPIAPYTSNLISISTTLESLASGVGNLYPIYIAANTVKPNLDNFKLHADRLSGVTPPNAETATLPHYESAIGVGKILAHLVYQSDGVANNAALIGSFGALYSTDNLNGYYIKLLPYPGYIANSISSETIETANGPVTVLSSNLTTELIMQITSDITNVNTFLLSTQSSDVNFFQNSRAVVDDYNDVKIFSKMGQTEQDLTKNLVGSDKLLSRIT